MSLRTKIFVAERDYGRLINILLYLEQFSDFELVGSAQDIDDLPSQLSDVIPDVILIDADGQHSESLAMVRSVKAAASASSVLFLCGHEPSALENILLAEADGLFKRNLSIKDLPESIRRVHNKRKTAVSVSHLPLTKAG